VQTRAEAWIKRSALMLVRAVWAAP